MTPGDVDCTLMWSQTLEALESSGVSDRLMGHLRLSRLVGFVNGTAVLSVPNSYTREIVEERCRDEITGVLSRQNGGDVHLAVSIDATLEESVPEPLTREVPAETTTAPVSETEATTEQAGPRLVSEEVLRQTGDGRQSAPARTVPDEGRSGDDPTLGDMGDTRLNPRYTFETFVAGSSNRFAHAAAVAVAEGPARAYNPLFIYGGSGLGKTHLLHAVGHYTRSLFPTVRVRYVNSEEFTNEFINSIGKGQAVADFHARYRSVDVLLIDDIQFLQGKTQTMEEFFHTFNALHNANKQIVITSDLPPKNLGGFEDRMRTRFEWGLLTDVQPPDLETRIAILRKKAAMEQLSAPDDVLEFIASKITTNIRELEGALIRVTAFANLTREPVNLADATDVLKTLIVDDATMIITAQLIMDATAEYYGLSLEDLTGQSRVRTIATPRQIAMYLCRELTELPLTKIGKHFGGRDHATVLHADRKVRELMNEKHEIFNQVTELTNRVKHRAR